MQPTPGDVHVNRPLTNISVAFIQSADNFIATKVFPTIPVQKQSDAYWSYAQAYWETDEMELRAPNAPTVGSGYGVDATQTYFAKVWGYHKDVDDQTRANADEPLNLDREATEFVTRKALIKREVLWVAAFFTAGIWDYDYAGVSLSPGASEVLQWNDAASTPIDDVWNAKEYLLEHTGFEPNVLVLGYPVFKALVNHPDFVDRVKYGQTPGAPAMVDLPEMAALFKVQRVLVMRAIRTTSEEGASSATRSFIGGKKAGLFYVPPSPGLMTASAGYTFVWTGYTGAGADGNRIKRFRMEPNAADRVEIEMAFDMKKIAASLGAFWDTLVA